MSKLKVFSNPTEQKYYKLDSLITEAYEKAPLSMFSSYARDLIQSAIGDEECDNSGLAIDNRALGLKKDNTLKFNLERNFLNDGIL